MLFEPCLCALLIMTDKESVQARIEALENALKRPRGSMARVGILFLVVLLMGNIWLVNQTLERFRQDDRERLFWVVCQPGYSAPDRKAAFIQLVADDNREWRSAHLALLDLEGTDLSGANVQLADLRRCNLSRSDLRETYLDDTLLSLSDLTDSDLSDSHLERVDLYKAILEKTRFLQSDMRGANLQQANSHEANFVLADLSEANMLMGDFTRANFTGANLTDANLEGAVLTGADLTLTRLTGATLKDADLTNCNWWRARGLRDDQLSFLEEEFPPSERSEVSLLSDYKEWIEGSVLSDSRPPSQED
jgi:uncharacterized protein YjbI with pentapeptide repeats